MSPLLVVALVFAFLFVNALFAYVPIILIIGYTLRPKEPDDPLLESYVVRDDITTEEWLAENDKRWEGKKHAPLRLEER